VFDDLSSELDHNLKIRMQTSYIISLLC